MIDGTDVGTIAIDSTGSGTLIVPVASLAATPVSGSTVTLGSLTGSLATSTSTASGGSDSGGCSHGENSTLTASVSDTGGDTATVTAQFGRIAGTKDVVVTVAGDTSAEGTSQDVTIDGTDAGSISIDSNGSGTLIVPLSTFASAPASGSTVVVGSLNGVFASSSSSSAVPVAHRFRLAFRRQVPRLTTRCLAVSLDTAGGRRQFLGAPGEMPGRMKFGQTRLECGRNFGSANAGVNKVDIFSREGVP